MNLWSKLELPQRADNDVGHGHVGHLCGVHLDGILFVDETTHVNRGVVEEHENAAEQNQRRKNSGIEKNKIFKFEFSNLMVPEA